MYSKMVLKWGIAGAGKISHDFVTVIQIYPKNQHEVTAVASHTLKSAEEFRKNHDIPKAYEGYEKLAKDTNIDIVYIGNLNHQHFETAKLMLNHGKHVLCEKPLTINEKQTKKLVEISRGKNLFLMEAIWSRCFPAYDDMVKIIKSGEIGDVLYVSVQFGVPLQHVERIKSKKLGGGAILDLGVYILQFQQYIFRNLRPVKVVASGYLNEDKTDECASAIISYPDGKLAVVSTSARVKMLNEGLVVGTKGFIKIPDFWCPTKLILNEKTYNYELPETKIEFVHRNSAGLAYEAEEVRQCIIAGKVESSKITHEESIELARLMDLLRKEVGVVFPEDSLQF